MNEPNPLLLPLIDGFRTLGLYPVEDDAACGEVDESPVLIKVLDAEPVSILLGVVVDHEAVTEEAVATLAGKFEELGERAKIELESGTAWLSFYDLDGWTGEQIAALVTHAAECVRSAGLAVGPGCSVCGVEPGASARDPQTSYLEGRVTRICGNCVEDLVAERDEAEEYANRALASHRLLFPAVIAGCMLAWGGLLYLRIAFTVSYPLVDWALAVVASGGIGFVAGRNLRGTGLARMGQGTTTIIATLAAAVGGNTMLFVIWLWVNFGVFSIELAVAALKANLAAAGGEFALLNLFQAIGFGVGCWVGSERRVLALNV